MFVPSARAVIADRYELIEEIGRGGMGSVWKAEHVGLGSACAVKFMLAPFAKDAGIRERFLREARAAARLQSAHVVRVFDADEWQGTLYIAMELLEGETLASRLERAGPLRPELACEVIEQVARALARAHAARLIHRDLKPDNVFLVAQEPGEPLLVKVLDFGLAKNLDLAGPHATKTGALLGTPGYMSPEQALGSKTVDERSDLWSLAAVAYHCVTGKEPFPGEGVGEILLAVMQGPLPVPSRDNPSVPPAFDDWWARSAQRNAAARPHSSAALARELRAALSVAPSDRSRYAEVALAATARAEMPSAPPSTRAARPDARGAARRAPPAERAARAFEPAARSTGTLQPASSSRSGLRDGFSVYALGAVAATAFGATGLVFWLRTRDASLHEPRARAPATGTTAELRPAPQPPALPAAPQPLRENSTAGASSVPPVSVEAAPARDSQLVPAGPPLQQGPQPATAAVAPEPARHPAVPEASAVSKPAVRGEAEQVSAVPEPASPPSGAPRPLESGKAADPPAEGQPPAPPSPLPRAPSPGPATEKKHERLGF